MAGPNQIPGPTAIRAPTLDLKNHQTVLTQLKETTETGQRLRGDPNQSYVKLGELVNAGIINYLGGVVSPGKSIGGGGGSSTVHVAGSITGDGSSGSPLELDGDAASPGASMYYGTNGSGTKGFFAVPVIGVVVNKVGANWVQVPFGTALSLPTNPVLTQAERAGTITEVRIYTIGGTGSCVVDIWKAAAGTVPSAGGDITGGVPPQITSGTSYFNSTLTSWNKTVTAGDMFLFTLASVSGSFTNVTILIRIG